MGKQWTDDMGEISGFGGGYEKVCRDMVMAGINWIDEHPNADPQFQGYKGVYGIINDQNQDAKDLTSAVIAASGGDCTGAMHQATISHVLAYKRLGWDAYRTELINREKQEQK